MDFTRMYELLLDKLEGWGVAAVEMLPNLVVAALCMVAFYFAGRGVRVGIGKLLGRMRVQRSVRHLMSRLAQFGVLVAGLMVSLSILNLDSAVTSLLAGAGVVGLAVGFAFQDIAANFISGVGLSFRRPFQIGDLVETNDTVGFAEKINLRSTELRTADGRLVILPNKEIFQTKLVNHSHHEKRRVDVAGGVSYDDDLEEVLALVRDACEAVEPRLDDHDVEVFFTGFGSSSIDFVAWFWIPYSSQADYIGARSSAIMNIKKAFDEAGVTIPFPIRTLDFGIRGGKELAEVLPKQLLSRDAA